MSSVFLENNSLLYPIYYKNTILIFIPTLPKDDIVCKRYSAYHKFKHNCKGMIHTVEYFDTAAIDAFSSHPSATVLRGTNGARMGVSLVASEEYGKVEDHDDQEGLFFIEGHGTALFNGEEYKINPQTYVLMPAHTTHCFRRDHDSCVIKLLWFHSAN